jgi:signal transduction histidine kinase
VRLRLTIIYAGLFLASGAGLLAITYVLVRQSTGVALVRTSGNGTTYVINRKQAGTSGDVFTQQVQIGQRGLTGGVAPERELLPAKLAAQIAYDNARAKKQHDAELRQLVEKSGIALAIMTVLSVLLGWLAAGRILRPLRTLSDHARAISATNLHRRLALTGPNDELKQLGDTFDDVLGRLEASFLAQRQFVANASHELRTPLARAQALAEVALGDPQATVETLRASHRRVIAAGRQQEQVIEALLTLARSERGLDRRLAFDLAAVTNQVIAARRDEAVDRGIQLHATLEPVAALGEPHLAERLAANIIDNALRHNVRRGGQVNVETTSRDGHAVLYVVNTGPVVPPDQIERLFRPFQRLGRERVERAGGVGLGLSIVQAIATAHDAVVTTTARPGGGLEIAVAFPGTVHGASQAETLQRSVRTFLSRRRSTASAL